MAALRAASDEKMIAGGLVFATWLAALVGAGLLLSANPAERAAPATPPPVAPSTGPGPGQAIATLPPTVVVAGRADTYAPACGPEHARANDRRCVFADAGRAWSPPEPDPRQR
ncbi:MAG: hypothetical protein JSR73_07385 [Proteobacteria bacterium]|nr:hypothetical protein [Pseudomonadota bacterium]